MSEMTVEERLNRLEAWARRASTRLGLPWYQRLWYRYKNGRPVKVKGKGLYKMDFTGEAP